MALYYQYYHGCSPHHQGLTRETLLKDQKGFKMVNKNNRQKSNAPTNFNRYKRTSVDGSGSSNRDQSSRDTSSTVM